MPREMCRDYPTVPSDASRTVVTYTAVGGEQIHDEGDCFLTAQDGDNVKFVTVQCKVGKVRKMLLAPAKIANKEHTIVLRNKWPYGIYHDKTGDFMK
eukprot:2101539-Heterocapsa_arctica.AAC.1